MVLIGIRGSGKSTLGVIAAAVFQRKLVETQHAFLESTGHSTSSFRKLFGPQKHQQKQHEVLSGLLRKYDTGCIIVCGDETLDSRCQSLLLEYCRAHPVVHIQRDAESIHDYLKGIGNEKVNQLLRVGLPMFRACSNYDFLNVSDTHERTVVGRQHGNAHDSHSPHPFLTLKKAEKHFLRFLALATHSGSGTLEAASPLSGVAVEQRPHTYAVAVHSEEILENAFDVDQAGSGADAFELIVEAETHETSATPARSSGSLAFATLRRNTIVPIVYHVHWDNSADDEGRPRGDSDLYLKAVQDGLRLSPEFVTVDLTLEDRNVRTIVVAKGSTRIIGDLNMEEESPQWSDRFWTTAYERAVSLGCDLVRLRRMAEPLEDNTAAQTFRDQLMTHESGTAPLIAYSTGQHGRFSAMMNPILTSICRKPRSSTRRVGLLRDEDTLTASDCGEALSDSFLYDKMSFYIAGASITYSLSPSMHNAGFQICGLPHVYKKHETSRLDDIRELIESPTFGGASITLPFKLDVITLTHSLSRHAQAIGAVNTLIPVRRLEADGSMPDEVGTLQQRNRAGKTIAILGENTDWIGLRSCLRRGLSPVNTVRPQTTGLVLGAGGMARAAIYAMLQFRVKNIFVYNRTRANAERIVNHFEDIVRKSQNSEAPEALGLGSDFSDARLHILPTLETHWPSGFRQPTIIVSCIPTHAIGDDPAPNFTLPEHWLQSPTGGVVLEVAYKTLHTPLLKQIRAEADRGWVAMDGLDLLPEQGFAQFELFTGRPAPRRLMRRKVLKEYRDSGVQDPVLIESRLAQIDAQEP